MFRRNSSQDLDDKELTGQAVDNKGVARWPLPAISTFPCWAIMKELFLRRKVRCHKVWLWKAVENYRCPALSLRTRRQAR
jgi:hypothetical protein